MVYDYAKHKFENIIFKMSISSNVSKNFYPFALLIGLLLLGSGVSFSQIDDALPQPYNLDFEIGDENSLPDGWWLGKIHREYGYQAKISTERKASGQQSLFIKNSQAATATEEIRNTVSCIVFQTIEASKFKGRTVRITASGMPASADVSGFRVFVRERFANGNAGAGDYNDDFVKQEAWAVDQIEYRFSTKADYFEFGVETKGVGSYYIDDFKIEYIDRTEVEPVASREITDRETDAIFNIAKVNYAFKAFNPFDEGGLINWNSVLYTSIKDVLSGKTSREIIDDRYVPIVAGLKVSDNMIQPVPIKREESFDPFGAMAWVHKGIYNENAADALGSRTTNIYQPITDMQASVFKTSRISEDLQGSTLVVNGVVATEPIGPGAHAQIWLRYETKDGKALRIRTMFDDMIRAKNWSKIRIKDTIPAEAEKLTVALVYYGLGKAYFDDVQVGIEQGKIIQYIDLGNKGFENSVGYPEGWNISNETSDNKYFVTVTEEKVFNGKKSLMISSPRTEFDKLPQEGETVTIKLTENGKDFFINFPVSLYIKNMVTYPTTKTPKGDLKKGYPMYSLKEEDMVSRLTLVSEFVGLNENFGFSSPSITQAKAVLKSTANGESDSKGALMTLLRLRGDAGARLWETFNYDRYTIPAYFEFVENGIVATNVYSEQINIGDKILSVNGVSIYDMVYYLSDNSPDQNKMLAARKALLDVLSFGEETDLKIELESPDGKKREVAVTADYPIAKISGNKLPPNSMLSEGTLYIDLREINDEEFKKAVKKIEGFDNLVFDMRGSSNLSEYMLGYFIDKPIDNITFDLPVFSRPGVANDVLSFKSSIKPLEPSLQDLKIYMIVDERTSSTLEQIAYLAKTNELATLIGTPTSGSISEQNYTTIGDRYTLALTVFNAYSERGTNRLPLNGLGVKPDHFIPLDFTSVTKKVDPAVLKAIELTRN
ncbi:MAG: hypothetical protein Kapaf2KO_19780 [Candidatus Kapaibacteriales bacterium]